jgi:hypothetical protein
LYDPGFPFPRSWLYGIGGFVFVAAAFAIGVVIANSGLTDTAEVKGRAEIVADRPTDEVLVVRAAPERARVFPAFAPEGVIVVPAPGAGERVFAANATTSAAPRRARLYERRPPVAVAEVGEEAAPEPRMEEPPQPAQNEAPPAREYEEASNDAPDEAEPDNRSWYGSEEYQREVAERRRARRRGQ